jgi:hypothetical protein
VDCGCIIHRSISFRKVGYLFEGFLYEFSGTSYQRVDIFEIFVSCVLHIYVCLASLIT